jgi:hypothetical protein
LNNKYILKNEGQGCKTGPIFGVDISGKGRLNRKGKGMGI